MFGFLTLLREGAGALLLMAMLAVFFTSLHEIIFPLIVCGLVLTGAAALLNQ